MLYVVAPSATIFAELLLDPIAPLQDDDEEMLLELAGVSLLEETGVLLLDDAAMLLLETTGASPISGQS